MITTLEVRNNSLSGTGHSLKYIFGLATDDYYSE